MPLKKKKYNARFPAGRIKKIMQSDEEVGKVAQAVPIIISRTLELFVESMLTKTMRITKARNAKTLSPSHMKQCIMSESRFDFLRELVKNIPDINVAEETESYPERRESSEDGELSIDSPNANGTNPNGATSAWPKSNRDGESNAGSSGTVHPHWKYTKQHSLDSLSKAQNHYTASAAAAAAASDTGTPINYSIKIKMDDEPTPAKLLRMESTPAVFDSSTKVSSPIVTPKFLPNDKQPIINFDFTSIPLLPSAASTSQTSTSLNHSHSVSNILKLNNKPSSTTETTKNELPSTHAKTTQRSAASKSQSTKSSTHSSASSTITSNSNSSSSTQNALPIHASSPSSVPILSYHIPSLSTITTSSTLEMDEDYDN